MAIDPVCGMKVDEQSAAGNAVHLGRRFYFCSPKCQHEFDANPVKYAGIGQAAYTHDHAQHHGHGMNEAKTSTIAGVMV